MNEVAADLLRQHAADLVAGLSQTRKEVMRRVLAQGLQRGWSDAVLQRRLAEVAGLDPRRALAVQNHRAGLLRAGVAPARAERQTQAYAKRLLKDRMRLIASTEMRHALMQAQRMVWQTMQAQGDYSPYAVRITRVHKDERLCPICRPENGKRRSLNKDLDQGPPFHPRCRCTEEVEDRGVAKREDGPMTMVSKAMPDGPMVYVPGVVGQDKRKKRKRPKKVEEALSKAITPGGRVGDASPLGTPGGKKNWVDNAGGLPKYIRMVAHAMQRKGKDESAAIRLAIGIVRNWAEGKGKVAPKVRAAAAKAIAEWEAKKAKAHVSKADQTTWNIEDYQMIVQQLTEEGVL